MSLSADDSRHGTYNGYVNLGCRCAECQKANAAFQRIRRQQRCAQGLEPDDERHGLASTYKNWGCRCAPCTQASTKADRMCRS